MDALAKSDPLSPPQTPLMLAMADTPPEVPPSGSFPSGKTPPSRFLDFMVHPHSGAPAQPMTLFHGSFVPGLKTLKAGTHVGTRRAAEERMERVLEQSNEQRFPGAAKVGEEQPAMYQTTFAPRTVLDMGDEMWTPEVVASRLYRRGVITPQEREEMLRTNDFITVLRNKGYDAIRYENTQEDPGSHSYLLLHDVDVSPADNK